MCKLVNTGSIRVALALAALAVVSQPLHAASKLKSTEDVSNVRVTKKTAGDRTVISITKGQGRVGSISIAPADAADTHICCYKANGAWTCNPIKNVSAAAMTNACPIIVYCTNQGICAPQ